MKMLGHLARGSVRFKKWLGSQRACPRVCWYPSAGEDLRDLLYLDGAFARSEPTLSTDTATDVEPPNLFLHTDYFPWESSGFLDTEILYEDERTKLTVGEVEELHPLHLPLDRRLVDLGPSSATGRCVFAMVRVQSDRLGDFVRPLVYAFVENAAFCAEMLIPQKARLSHVVCIRHGGGCGGGGKARGFWLIPFLRRLGAEAFVADLALEQPCKDEAPSTSFPALKPARAPRGSTLLREFRRMPAHRWSDYGQMIRWFRVAERA